MIILPIIKPVKMYHSKIERLFAFYLNKTRDEKRSKTLHFHSEKMYVNEIQFPYLQKKMEGNSIEKKVKKENIFILQMEVEKRSRYKKKSHFQHRYFLFDFNINQFNTTPKTSPLVISKGIFEGERKLLCCRYG